MCKILCLLVLIAFVNADFDIIDWRGGEFIFGADYYPEAWPSSIWEDDAKMMQAARINFVRVGEFAWQKIQPGANEQFDFSWLDDAISVLNKYGILVVVGTPTASPPAWLYELHPEIALVDDTGVTYRYGSRCNINLIAPAFINATITITTAVAKHYANHPGVIGFQIGNEITALDDYSAITHRAFQNWCQTKYGSLDALNDAWGTIFWGHTYTTWEQVPLPWNTLSNVHNPSLALDYRRFGAEQALNYVKLQSSILKATAPSKAITTNEMATYSGVDYSEWFNSLNFASWDNYPVSGNSEAPPFYGAALGHAIIRGTGNQQNFLVMEEQSGPIGWTLYWSNGRPAILRNFAYSAIANGADGICFFRWRTSRYGTEQHWEGILSPDSYPNPRYKMISQMGSEVADLTPLLHGTKVKSEVGILYSYDSMWALDEQPIVDGLSITNQMTSFLGAFRSHMAFTDVIFPQQDWSNYKVIVVPTLLVVDDNLGKKISDFVEGGGVLILTLRSGDRDAYNRLTTLTLPGVFAQISGISIHEWDPYCQLNEESITPIGKSTPRYNITQNGRFCDILDTTTASSIFTYSDGYYSGRTAVSLNSFGKGSVIYVGANSDDPMFYDDLVQVAASRANFTSWQSDIVPSGLEISRRQSDNMSVTFLINFTDKLINIQASYVKISHSTEITNALTGQQLGGLISVPAYDVLIIYQYTQ